MKYIIYTYSDLTLPVFIEYNGTTMRVSEFLQNIGFSAGYGAFLVTTQTPIGNLMNYMPVYGGNYTFLVEGEEVELRGEAEILRDFGSVQAFLTEVAYQSVSDPSSFNIQPSSVVSQQILPLIMNKVNSGRPVVREPEKKSKPKPQPVKQEVKQEVQQPVKQVEPEPVQQVIETVPAQVSLSFDTSTKVETEVNATERYNEVLEVVSISPSDGVSKDTSLDTPKPEETVEITLPEEVEQKEHSKISITTPEETVCITNDGQFKESKIVITADTIDREVLRSVINMNGSFKVFMKKDNSTLEEIEREVIAKKLELMEKFMTDSINEAEVLEIEDRRQQKESAEKEELIKAMQTETPKEEPVVEATQEEIESPQEPQQEELFFGEDTTILEPPIIPITSAEVTSVEQEKFNILDFIANGSEACKGKTFEEQLGLIEMIPTDCKISSNIYNHYSNSKGEYLVSVLEDNEINNLVTVESEDKSYRIVGNYAIPDAILTDPINLYQDGLREHKTLRLPDTPVIFGDVTIFPMSTKVPLGIIEPTINAIISSQTTPIDLRDSRLLNGAYQVMEDVIPDFKRWVNVLPSDTISLMLCIELPEEYKHNIYYRYVYARLWNEIQTSKHRKNVVIENLQEHLSMVMHWINRDYLEAYILMLEGFKRKLEEEDDTEFDEDESKRRVQTDDIEIEYFESSFRVASKWIAEKLFSRYKGINESIKAIKEGTVLDASEIGLDEINIYVSDSKLKMESFDTEVSMAVIGRIKDMHRMSKMFTDDYPTQDIPHMSYNEGLAKLRTEKDFIEELSRFQIVRAKEPEKFVFEAPLYTRVFSATNPNNIAGLRVGMLFREMNNPGKYHIVSLKGQHLSKYNKDFVFMSGNRAITEDVIVTNGGTYKLNITLFCDKSNVTPECKFIGSASKIIATVEPCNKEEVDIVKVFENFEQRLRGNKNITDVEIHM